ncbi:MAG: DUF3291 domain-containing protein [Deltaproteobacteria bacterium]|nr:DUF3291 domain-containing protein [Deltaproteobacteria bacterium]
MTAFELAQVNIALPREPLDSPLLADFVAALAPINALADRSPGFVWRLGGDSGDATEVRGFGDDRMLINMSTWTSLEALADYVFRSAHTEVMRQRRTWFEAVREATSVLWWVPAGHRPTIAEAEARLASLRASGPTPFAFTFKQPFAAPAADPST